MNILKTIILLLALTATASAQAYVTGRITPDAGGGGTGAIPTWQDVRRCVISVEGQNGIEATGRISQLWKVNLTVASPDPTVIYHLTWDCPQGVALSLAPLDFQLLPTQIQTFYGIAVFTEF